MDFERGSTFGGIMTSIVFVGFASLLVYDTTYNISNKPYSLEVRDKFMSSEELMATQVNFGAYNQSQELVLGFTATKEDGTLDTDFNPLDNDYFEVIATWWDYEMSAKEGQQPFY